MLPRWMPGAAILSAAVLLPAGASLVGGCSDDGASSASAAVGGGGGGSAGQGGVAGAGGLGGSAGVGGSPPAPPLRNPVDLSDADLAYQSLLLMGHEPLGATGDTCSQCHALNSGLMSYWRDLTDTAVASCFADPTVPSEQAAEAVISCLRSQPQPSAPFSTPKLGIYSAAAHLDWFAFVFDRAYDGDGAAELADFQQHVAMPQNALSPYTQADFDIIAEWFARGLPFMEELLPGDPGPGGCAANITPSVASHIADMQLTGWRTVNENANLLMFGCAGAATALDCLASYPLASSLPFGAGWAHMPGATLRVLRTHSYPSLFASRSSADGRFVGHGGGVGGSTVIDLALDSEIPLDAAYDPAFLPDNSAFMFHGTPTGAGICTQDLLASAPAAISFQEPQCSVGGQIGLYQQLGAALGGGDYWAVHGDFVSDDGGHGPTLDSLSAFFDAFSDVVLTPMVFDGASFSPQPPLLQGTPFEGDVVMSPSSSLLMGRVAGAGWVQNGFRLRRLVATPNGNSYTVSIPEAARYCINGSKPAISYDERWAVFHRYVTGADAVELGFSGPSDPGFADYASQGAANVYLLDLLTGLVRRVTHMQAGQYALFPHFRSDGWMYFIVRTVGSGSEHIVASDAVLTLAG